MLCNLTQHSITPYTFTCTRLPTSRPCTLLCDTIVFVSLPLSLKTPTLFTSIASVSLSLSTSSQTKGKPATSLQSATFNQSSTNTYTITTTTSQSLHTLIDVCEHSRSRVVKITKGMFFMWMISSHLSFQTSGLWLWGRAGQSWKIHVRTCLCLIYE